MRQQENTAQLTDNKVTEKKTTILIEYLLMYMYHCKCIPGPRKTIKLK